LNIRNSLLSKYL